MTKTTPVHHGVHTEHEYRILQNNQFILLLVVGIIAISVAFLYINNFSVRPKAMDAVDSGGWTEEIQQQPQEQQMSELQEKLKEMQNAVENITNILKNNAETQEAIQNDMPQY